MDDTTAGTNRGAGGAAVGRRTLAALLGLVAILGFGAGVGAGAGVWAGASRPPILGPARAQAARAGGDLFVVDAVSGSAARSGATSWRLQLRGATVLWFKDRPQRGSGAQTIGSFVSAWASRFSGSPPYGAVLAPAGPSGHHPTAVALTDPAFDQQTGIASFTLTPDKGESAADAAWLSKLTPSSASKNGRLVLFIDDSNGSQVVNGCVIQPGSQCTGADLRNVDLTNVDLDNANLIKAQLSGATLTGASLVDAGLYGANLSGVNLQWANLSGTDLRATNLSYAAVGSLDGNDLTGANLTGAYLVGIDFSGVNLANANLSGANLSVSDLSHAENLSSANTSGATFCHTQMSDNTYNNADC